MPKALDITGQRYGKLVALHRVRKNKTGSWLWAFKCDCGNIKVLLLSTVRHTTSHISCGCGQQKARAHFIAKRNCNKLTIEDLDDISW